MREYRQEYGCDPSDRELCAFLYVSREKLDQIRKAAQVGREGVGIYLMKNHEGYHDPTAGKAIRRAHRAKRRGRGSKTRPLTYLIGEAQGLPVSLVK